MIRITGMNSGLDTDAMVQELVNSYSKKTENIKKQQTKAEWKMDAWKELNTKVTTFFNKHLSNMRWSSSYSKKATVSSNESKVSVVASDNAVNGTQTIKVKGLASAGYLTGSKMQTKDGSKLSASTKLSQLGFEPSKPDEEGNVDDSKKYITLTKGIGESAKTYKLEVTEDTTVKDVAKFYENAGLNSNFDASTGRIFLSSKKSGENNDFTVGGDADALKALGLSEAAGAVKQDAKSAEIELNGATFKSDTNTFSVNGLSITVKGETDDNETINLVTDTDYNSIYDNIKSFLKEYNSLIKEFDKLYNAADAKKYEPLTSEEKEEMTDEEIEKWEEKIKGSLLRRDSTIGDLSSIMKTAMLSTFEIGGKTMSLSNFGIDTLDYFTAAENEKSVLHIDGDEDDADVSGKTDKLKAMIASDPEATASFFQKLCQNMYDNLSAKINSSNSYKSFGSAYDDKLVKSNYEEYEKKLADWEDYVGKIEDKYYKQFSAMETALSSLQSQQTYISNMIG